MILNGMIKSQIGASSGELNSPCHHATSNFRLKIGLPERSYSSHYIIRTLASIHSVLFSYLCKKRTKIS